MPQLLLEQLAELYQQDYQDLEALLEDLQKLETTLAEEIAGSAQEKREQSLKDQGNVLEEILVQFTEQRNSKFQLVQQRAAEAEAIQDKICRSLKINEFTAENLRRCDALSLSEIEELSDLHQKVRASMQKVLEMDEKVIQQLRIELEAVKLELHRLQGANKSKSAYQGQGYKEARFIDKTK